VTFLHRGLSYDRATGRILVDVSAEHSVHFPAETRGVLPEDAADRLTSCRNPRCTVDYAFSPTGNCADLKGTPQPPIPQYPLGFFARYCW
jgi:hypothetical protein